ncbi:hypothetical protein PIB30_046328 [Stylosanthes scabra]|uniref:Uncharacterized protein n=1 Tax=Stylosanthes scabra TaxID=79078 RepID=A0ABU6UGZ8_9FABA|nr:hypothetical protein [Stylosanthes scabra]
MSSKDAAAKMLPLLPLTYSISFTSNIHHSFEDFGLVVRDYLIGSHKLKKKRRDEAQKQQHDVLRKKHGEEHKNVGTAVLTRRYGRLVLGTLETLCEQVNL